MTTKQQFMQEGGDVNLVNENEKPKVGKKYAERLSDALHVPVRYNDGEKYCVAIPNGESYFAPHPMEGVKWNGSSIANKGSTRSEGRGMFSVGNLIAFETSGYCSPDGRQSAKGVNLLHSSYQLQDEIKLEEYDNTEVDNYGSGRYDRQEKITLPAVFLHNEYRNENNSYYLVGIFKDNIPRLEKKYHKGQRIEEIRDNPGLYLHVYSMGSYENNLASQEHNIEDAIKKIKEKTELVDKQIDMLEQQAQEKRETLKVNFTKEGIQAAKLKAERSYGSDTHWGEYLKDKKLKGFDKLVEYIDDLNTGNAFAMRYKSGYYSKPANYSISSDLDIGIPDLGTDDHFGNSVRGEEISVYKIAKKTKTKMGIYCGSFYAGGIVDIFQKDNESLLARVNRYENWANSQDWSDNPSYDIMRYDIETGEEGECKRYNDTLREKRENNKNRFNEFSSKVAVLYGKDIVNAVRHHKGKVLAILEHLSNDELAKKLVGKKDLLEKALQVSVDVRNSNVVLSLISLIVCNPSTIQIDKVFGKTFSFDTSRKHYDNILGGVPTYGQMSQVSEAYRIYCLHFKDYADVSKRRFDKKRLERDFRSKGFSSVEEYSQYLSKIDQDGIYTL